MVYERFGEVEGVRFVASFNGRAAGCAGVGRILALKPCNDPLVRSPEVTF